MFARKRITSTLLALAALALYAPFCFATNFTPTTGAQLQADINSAVYGDTITLDHTLTYTLGSGLNLPVKAGCTGASFVTILSDDLASLPAGVRVNAAAASHMPTLKLTDSGGGLGVVFTGGCYKLLGLHVTNDVGSGAFAVTNNFFDLGTVGYNTIDRGYYHPKECPNTVAPYNTTGRNIFYVPGGTLDVISNNYAPCFFGLPMGQTAGATAWDSNGLLTVQADHVTYLNNYTETWFNGFFAGGADTTPTSSGSMLSGNLTTLTFNSAPNGLVAGMPIAVPLTWNASWCERDNTHVCYGNGTVASVSGNTITYSHLIGTDAGKASGRITIPNTATLDFGNPALWNGLIANNFAISKSNFHINTAFAAWQFAHNGNHPKGYFEIKELRDSTVDGCLFDGYYSTLGFAAANQSGGSPWVKISNVVVSNSWVNGVNEAFVSTFADPYYLNTQGGGNVVSNVLFTSPDLDGTFTNVVPQLLGGQGGISFTVDHVTFYAGNNYTAKWAAWSSVAPQFSPAFPTSTTITNSIIGSGNYGFTCDAGSTLVCWPGLVENKNLFVLNVNPPNQNPVTDQHFPNSATVASYAAMLFTSVGGANLSDWVLQNTSPGHGTGTGGTDVGVNVSTISAACPDCGGVVPPPPISGGTVLNGKIVITGKVVIQ